MWSTVCGGGVTEGSLCEMLRSRRVAVDRLLPSPAVELVVLRGDRGTDAVLLLLLPLGGITIRLARARDEELVLGCSGDCSWR